jgi:Leucine-rich repeat (LRR) protein
MELGCLTHLQSLNLSGNNIQGTLPDSIVQLSLLESLDLSTNDLSGTLPELRIPYYNLHTIILHNNKFHGSLPSSWDAPQLPNLTIFNIANNSLSGSIQPDTWGNFSKLTVLDLSYNNLSGVTPNGLKEARMMRTYCLSLNVIYSSLYTDQHISLEISVLIDTLSLSYNLLTGSQEVVCSLIQASSLTTDCLSAKMGITYSTLKPAFPCDCCTTCCSKTEGCFPQINRVTGNRTRM